MDHHAGGRRDGVFVALEGVEGSGKSTQTRLLAEWLEDRGLPHIVTREPGGTAVGERARRMVLDAGAVPPRTELLLILAARSALVTEVVEPALEAGKVVVTDRWALSTLAYQGHGRGLPLDEVRALNDFATAGVGPDLTVVLDVDLATGEARLQERGRAADRIESEVRAFHQRVAEGYRALSATESRVVVLDASGPAPEVHAAVVSLLAERFPGTFGERAG